MSHTTLSQNEKVIRSIRVTTHKTEDKLRQLQAHIDRWVNKEIDAVKIDRASHEKVDSASALCSEMHADGNK